MNFDSTVPPEAAHNLLDASLGDWTTRDGGTAAWRVDDVFYMLFLGQAI